MYGLSCEHAGCGGLFPAYGGSIWMEVVIGGSCEDASLLCFKGHVLTDCANSSDIGPRRQEL